MRPHFRPTGRPVADPANVLTGDGYRITVLDDGLDGQRQIEVGAMGLDATGGVGVHRSVYPNGDVCEYLTVWFRCRAVGGSPRPDGEESVEVAWFAPDALPEVSPRVHRRIAATASPTGEAWFDDPGQPL